MSDFDRLPIDQLYVLCQWSVEALADQLGIGQDDAYRLLEAAYHQGRVTIQGNNHFSGVAVDGAWLCVVGRYQLQQAAHEWQTLRFLERQFED